MTEETAEQRKLRETQEAQCRKIADSIAPMLPPNTGFVLFLADFDKGSKISGSLSYVSSIRRPDSLKMIRDWLIRQL